MTTQPRALLEQAHTQSSLGCRQCGTHSGSTATDDCHICVHKYFETPTGIEVPIDIQRADSGQLSDSAQEKWPGPVRLVKYPVIETGRHEAIEPVDEAVEIRIGAPTNVLRTNSHARLQEFFLGVLVRYAVDVHQRVRAFAVKAVQTARPMIFEAATEDTNTAFVHSHCDGVAGASGHTAPHVAELDLPVPVDALGGRTWQPTHCSIPSVPLPDWSRGCAMSETRRRTRSSDTTTHVALRYLSF